MSSVPQTLNDKLDPGCDDVIYTTLGKTDLKVSTICLGTAFRSKCDETTCIAAIDRAAELGCNYLDCANIYRRGFSEQVLGKAVKGRRDQFVISTKVGAEPDTGGPLAGGLTRELILRNVETSLQRLDTDYLDCYLCHFPDPQTPIEETLGALDLLVRQGKTRHIGCSNYQAADLRDALNVAEKNSFANFICDQIGYSVLDRSIEDELVPFCCARGVSITVYASTAIGLLSGRYRFGQPPPPDTSWRRGPYNFRAAMTEPVGQVIGAVIDIADRHGKTPTQVAIAWCLRQAPVASVIIGADNPQRVDEDFGAADWTLPDEEYEQLNSLSRGHRLRIRKDCQEGYDGQTASGC